MHRLSCRSLSQIRGLPPLSTVVFLGAVVDTPMTIPLRTGEEN